MKRGSSLRFIEWPMPQILASVFAMVMAGSSAHFLGRVLHGLDDVDVAGAAAQIARERLAELLAAGVLVALVLRDVRKHHAGGADGALQAVVLGEALLLR